MSISLKIFLLKQIVTIFLNWSDKLLSWTCNFFMRIEFLQIFKRQMISSELEISLPHWENFVTNLECDNRNVLRRGNLSEMKEPRGPNVLFSAQRICHNYLHFSGGLRSLKIKHLFYLSCIRSKKGKLWNACCKCSPLCTGNHNFFCLGNMFFKEFFARKNNTFWVQTTILWNFDIFLFSVQV